MTPFSIKLREIREHRGLIQKDMADILGYEQSYLSALETGLKAPPKYPHLKRLIEKLDLAEEEVKEFEEAAFKSRLVFKIPRKIRPEILNMCHRLEGQLLTISNEQIQLISIALNMNQSTEANNTEGKKM